MTLSTEDISKLIKAEKRLIGRPNWVASHQGEGKLSLKVSLNHELELNGKLDLCAHVSLYAIKQKGALVLTCNELPVERITIYAPAVHVNPPKAPKPLGGLIFDPDVIKYHSWNNNKHVGWTAASESNLRVAAAVPEEISDFQQAVNYFLGKINLSGEIPAPKYEPRFVV